jgi:hypothetical protein
MVDQDLVTVQIDQSIVENFRNSLESYEHSHKKIAQKIVEDILTQSSLILRSGKRKFTYTSPHDLYYNEELVNPLIVAECTKYGIDCHIDDPCFADEDDESCAAFTMYITINGPGLPQEEKYVPMVPISEKMLQFQAALERATSLVSAPPAPVPL